MSGIKMKLLKHKKAVVFSLLSILLSTMFILILTSGLKSELESGIEFSRSRADTVNAYYDSFRDYSRFVFEISAKACVDAISQDIVNNIQFYPDEETFYNDVSRCMLTGSISFPSDHELIATEGLLIDDIFEILTNLTEGEYKIKSNYTVNDINILTYTNSGDVYSDEFKVVAKTTVELSDDNILLSPGEFQTVVRVKLNGMIDPYYSINTSTLKRINDIIVIGKNDDHLRNLKFSEFLEKVDYIQYFKGVSIMNRVVNNFSESDVGVISFLNRSTDYETDSYVDIYKMDNTYFPSEDLYCEKKDGACIDGDYFRIDAVTLAAMEARYDLDVSDWGRI